MRKTALLTFPDTVSVSSLHSFSKISVEYLPCRFRLFISGLDHFYLFGFAFPQALPCSFYFVNSLKELVIGSIHILDLLAAKKTNYSTNSAMGGWPTLSPGFGEGWGFPGHSIATPDPTRTSAFPEQSPLARFANHDTSALEPLSSIAQSNCQELYFHLSKSLFFNHIFRSGFTRLAGFANFLCYSGIGPGDGGHTSRPNSG
ncbi:MAG: hypothetical protein ACE14M_12595, partial [Terriglobales bacterium]